VKVVNVFAAVTTSALIVAGCAGSGSEESIAASTVGSIPGTSAVAEVPSTLSTESVASDAPADGSGVEFPPPGLPLRTDDEIVVPGTVLRFWGELRARGCSPSFLLRWRARKRQLSSALSAASSLCPTVHLRSEQA
jgi:hypothetical protein